jgi:hypothetical protein
MRRVVYANRVHSFTVSGEAGRLVLEVLCGQSGMYAREHWLTAEEIATYRANPDDLATLALSLCKQ